MVSVESPRLLGRRGALAGNLSGGRTPTLGRHAHPTAPGRSQSRRKPIRSGYGPHQGWSQHQTHRTVDGRGRALQARLEPGPRSDFPITESMVPPVGKRVIADKGYDSDKLRRHFTRRGARTNWCEMRDRREEIENRDRQASAFSRASGCPCSFSGVGRTCVWGGSHWGLHCRFPVDHSEHGSQKKAGCSLKSPISRSPRAWGEHSSQ